MSNNHMQTAALETMICMVQELSLERLAELQLEISKRMSQLINNTHTQQLPPTTTLDPTTLTQQELVEEIEEIQERTNPNSDAFKAARKTQDDIARADAQRDQWEDVTNGGASFSNKTTKRTKSKKATQSTKPSQPTKTTKQQVTKAASPLSENVHPHTMSYAQLRSILSTSTKANTEAKAIAQRVAKERSAKSWATIGRDGFEELYKLLLDKRLIVEV